MANRPRKRPKQTCRPLEHLAAVGCLYPQAWRQIDNFRASNGKGGLPSWPDWCFLPMAGFYAIVSREAGADTLPPHLLPDVARLAAAGTWRYTQGIYRAGPAAGAAAESAKMLSGLPCETLYRLPDWCVYVETPGRTLEGEPLHGFFAHLEWDADRESAALRLLLDGEAGLFPSSIRLDAEDLGGAVAQAADAARQQATGAGRFSATRPEPSADGLADTLEPLVALLPPLCGVDGDGQDTTDGGPSDSQSAALSTVWAALHPVK